MIDGKGISCETVFVWLSLDVTDDKSTLVQVMAWCRQATSHYLSQCWPRSLSPYGITRPQWMLIWWGVDDCTWTTVQLTFNFSSTCEISMTCALNFFLLGSLKEQSCLSARLQLTHWPLRELNWIFYKKNFKLLIILVIIYGSGISSDTAFRWMSLDLK